jgi:hypothetical protein
MASKYLKNLYQDNGYYYTSNVLGMKQAVKHNPGQFNGIGGQNPRWQAGAQQSVVHDTLNNKYYGTQSFDQITKGLTDHMARTQAQLKKGYVMRSNAGVYGNSFRHYYSAKEKQNMNESIANQQKYLSSITKDNYSIGQHGDKFFESYEAHTQDYNNIYQRTYNNTEQEKRNKKIKADNARKQKEHEAALERNRLQAIENDKIAARNKKIKGEEEALEQNNNKLGNDKNKSRAKPLKPNLTIGTGLAGSAYQGISNSGLSI